ncbi:tyrosine-protein phosphatase [Microbacterium stercoris]|uniref:Tyrosine-protein phosphatase n=1 Tax=Microbacterium stercoris TaxID=2820289 RepID=A0A939TQX9_9MICO|nr:tyrosine-protein phosphatase [Microbacterium stercoris]MBO3663930.1 tyrosine-protein phosphatase [Microbacterium stercoris]
MERTLTIAGLANARDLGGLTRRDGSVTPWGVFVRTERLDRVDAQGWDALRAHGVRTVIDLRRPSESTGHAPTSVAHVRVDLDGDEAEFWEPYEADGRWGTPLYYLAHLRELPHRLAAVLEAIAAAEEGAILFHCSAGWDRTGLLAAVLLRALDVETDAAVADYLLSFANADAMAALHQRSSEAEGRHMILRQFGHTAESAFRDMYENLDLAEWFRVSRTDPTTRVAIETWRGAVGREEIRRRAPGYGCR